MDDKYDVVIVGDRGHAEVEGLLGFAGQRGHLIEKVEDVAGLPELGGSDSHVPITAGQALTWFRGWGAADLRRSIERNQVFAGGTLWSVTNMARLLPMLVRRGLPRQRQPLPKLDGVR